MLELIVATKNKKKLKEIWEILRGFNLKLSSLVDYSRAPRIIENGKTFKDNAVKKAVKIARFSKKLVLGEDSGLCVNALSGAPGVYSSRFSGKNKSDIRNNLKLLKLLRGLPLNKRKAYYICAVALADEHGLLGVVEGKCRGAIGFVLKGSRGFGYDPLFVIPKYNKTFAQLGEKIKYGMSHRYHALSKAKKIIQKYIEKHKGN
ncbi:MAG: non-canonical purine NTP pyrophosphatase, RdgB/HAM1 family [Candidatus Omnitrophica bacterium CG08_land_8_20_14_0_20_41_16]|uniref:dITP/XTP pyrophosphatase n=1 Tax=Candidatus Sherwoodlollariibacterium unditelluris TaxID=1974757 RepID=A0A2G9YKK2_9BACT|nr:MAG: non-canonical purine NTP pyrophosphatase, RdgB/HAM1 family [Candidatus Omnitrophica bacterium CG23_combo_of_CG06-09_8_20_14_all_41_10]PIS33313.1 MAG: non-canonical purine NTP pyrophosphatase, RdgB/HAM1 family [Candidatus Omnitrophica bacterium CG08_land_8_20_14_0_20_41_16]